MMVVYVEKAIWVATGPALYSAFLTHPWFTACCTSLVWSKNAVELKTLEFFKYLSKMQVISTNRLWDTLWWY